MKWVLVGLLVAAAAAVGGVDAEVFDATGRERSNLMRIDWSAGYTLEELEDGAYMRTASSSSSRVINGKQLKKVWSGRYVASIWRYDSGFFYFTCTGSVVDKNIILTAAHCMDTNGTYAVCVSGVDLHAGVCFLASDGRVPSQYFTSTKFTHDIGLLKVNGDLLAAPSKAKIIPVDLAKNDVPEDGLAGYLFGFGTNNEAATINDPYLHRLDVHWKKFSDCVRDPQVKSFNFLCVDGNYDGSLGGICFGDSGGPLVWSKDGSKKPGQHVQIGVASFGYPDPDLGSDTCDIETPDGYASTASWQHTKFLQSAMAELGGSFTVYKAEPTV